MEKNLPHLVVTDFERNKFTATGGGNSENKSPKRIRNEHSDLLKGQLTQAWSESANDQVVYETRRNGIYLEFKGAQGYSLVTKSLENRLGKDSEKWVRLLNVRSEKPDTQNKTSETTYATVYVPNSKKDWFFNKIKKYATEDTNNGKPQNAPLIESISRIRKALEIESFW